MDNTPDGIPPQDISTLSYDEDVAYEAQLPTEAEIAASSLANRISRSKVYLLSESSATNRPVNGKYVKSRILISELVGFFLLLLVFQRGNTMTMRRNRRIWTRTWTKAHPVYRTNALLLRGSPIEHLPTARIFAYATHFDAHPMGLEWVDDNTCVLVFKSRREALEAFTRLQKSASEEPEEDDCTTARPLPVVLWPPEERINETLGQGQGLKGPIRMRWAKRDDVKKKNAMRESKFYKRHGSMAGKELFNGRDLPPPKRRRHDDYRDDDARRAELDDELDRFLAEDNSNDERQGEMDSESIEVEDLPPSPPSKMRSDYILKDTSKMRSDYISGDGRTLLERTSLIRVHKSGFDEDEESPTLATRLTIPLRRRGRGRRGVGDRNEYDTLDPKTLESLSDRLQPQTTEKLEWGPGTSDSTKGDRRRGEIRIYGASNDLSGDRERRRSHRRREREREGKHTGKQSRGQRLGERPKKTQQELDDELDAFLRAPS
ncbi:hypothetical protein JR316_0005095 [Psilocybe cubensis]|uniref:Chromatin target of PRMT1 protein C-terminal domain-containing protein n=2 Tax=Psilocybe cubensis TaxID=181762 RepID=A0A8H8CM11_PSICU|nr:hypothetical protein JR316_0005095 [Psilocybe cubensis]KAH9482995.1 hypothetical protein JR316_0005095 [Psilocybe cubensis]